MKWELLVSVYTIYFDISPFFSKGGNFFPPLTG